MSLSEFEGKVTSWGVFPKTVSLCRTNVGEFKILPTPAYECGMLRNVFQLTIDQSNINIPKNANGLRDGEDKRPGEVYFEQRPEANLVVVARPPSTVIRLFALERGLFAEDGRGVGFLDAGDADPGDAGGDDDDPVSPSPAEVLVDEA